MKSFHPITVAATMGSPSGKRAQLLITIFHRVLDRPDPLLPGIPDIDRFRWQIKLLAKHFNILPLRDAAQRLVDGNLPARAAAVTFDDGYADNLTNAIPVLAARGLPATFFVATDYLDGGRMFNDTVIELVRRLDGVNADFSTIGLGMEPCSSIAERRALITKLINHFKYQPSEQRRTMVETMARKFGVALPNNMMMSTDQLRELARAPRAEVGAHTHTHPILSRVPLEQAREEIHMGKDLLESKLQTPIRLFAYPNGRPQKDYGPEHVQIVRNSGFDFAVSTTPAPARQGSDPYQLPRFTPWDRTPGRFALRTLQALYRPA